MESKSAKVRPFLRLHITLHPTRFHHHDPHTSLRAQDLALASPQCRRSIVMFFRLHTAVLVSKSWRTLKCQQMTRLIPANCSTQLITNAVVVALANACRNLTTIHLGYTKVTDIGAQALANGCRNLTTIHLHNTKVTKECKKQMRDAHPTLLGQLRVT